MIADWFLSMGRDFGLWLAGLLEFAGIDMPQDVRGAITGMVSQFASLSVWFPWVAVIAAVGVSVTVWGICLGIKAARAVIAHIPFGLGGAG